MKKKITLSRIEIVGHLYILIAVFWMIRLFLSVQSSVGETLPDSTVTMTNIFLPVFLFGSGMGIEYIGRYLRVSREKREARQVREAALAKRFPDWTNWDPFDSLPELIRAVGDEVESAMEIPDGTVALAIDRELDIIHFLMEKENESVTFTAPEILNIDEIGPVKVSQRWFYQHGTEALFRERMNPTGVG